MILSATAFSQSYTLQAVYFDSLTFEVRNGRACEKLAAAQSLALLSADSLMNASKTVIRLQDQQITTLDAQNALWKRQLQDERIIAKSQADKDKRKIKRQKVVIGALAVILSAVLIL